MAIESFCTPSRTRLGRLDISVRFLFKAKSFHLPERAPFLLVPLSHKQEPRFRLSWAHLDLHGEMCGESQTSRVYHQVLLTEINCGSPGILPNGWLEGQKTTLHAVVTFRCQEGMTFEGPSYRTICLADGRWSHPLPRCYGKSSLI